MGEAINISGLAQLVRVDPRYPGAWGAVVPYLREALEKGDGVRDWSERDIYQSAIDGRTELWAVVTNGSVSGAMLTCVTRYPQRSVVEVIAAGADAHSDENWLPLLEDLKNMARAIGATAIVGTGRNGWGRKLNATRTRVVWELDI